MKIYAFDNGVGFEFISDSVEINICAKNVDELIQIWTDKSKLIHKKIYSEYPENQTILIDIIDNNVFIIHAENLEDLQRLFIEISTKINVELVHFKKRSELFKGSVDEFFNSLTKKIEKCQK